MLIYLHPQHRYRSSGDEGGPEAASLQGGGGQIIDRKLSKYSVMARITDGQMTTTTVEDSQINFVAPSLQIESTTTHQFKTPTGICSSLVDGDHGGGGGANIGLSIGSNSDYQQIRLISQSEAEDVDPDVIPNQFGKRALTLLLLLLFAVANSSSGSSSSYYVPYPFCRTKTYKGPHGNAAVQHIISTRATLEG